jgi:hypothetical protein
VDYSVTMFLPPVWHLLVTMFSPSVVEMIMLVEWILTHELNNLANDSALQCSAQVPTAHYI